MTRGTDMEMVVRARPTRCPAGFFVSGYTYGPGTGQFLWTLMDHYQLTRDQAWMKSFLPQVTKMCNYIAGQTERTKRPDVQGEKMPEHGLMTPGRGADWGHWGYIFKISGHCYAGLSRAAQTLKEFDVPEAANLVQKKLGGGREIHIISGYRSPEYNARLVRARRRAAKNSLHIQGQAIDIQIPGIHPKVIRQAALELGYGGIGYYPRSKFVHLDSGAFRSW